MRATDARVATAAAPSRGLRHALHPGAPDTEQRRRVIVRIAAHLTRRIAVESGARRLAVRARSGPMADQIVIAFPWRRRDAAQAFARGDGRRHGADARGSLAGPVRRGRGHATGPGGTAGPEPTVADPEVPVIQVTGTNGKTSTVRLLRAHRPKLRPFGGVLLHRRCVPRTTANWCRRGDYSGVRRGGPRARPAARHRGAGERPRRPAAPRLRRPAQRRGRGHQRERGSPGPARDRQRGPARRGEGHHHPNHAPAVAGTCSTRTTRGSWRCAATRPGRPWFVSLDPHHPVDPRRAERTAAAP